MSETKPLTPAEKASALQGRTHTVTLINGQTEEWPIRQVALREYKASLAMLEDEMALVSLCTGKSVSMIEANLTPNSYDALALAVRELNKSFFAYGFRRTQTYFAMVGDVKPQPNGSTPSRTSSGMS
jgi:hypothetical protein